MATNDFVPNVSTQLCISVAKRPGTFGVKFHNFLFRELDLNFVYEARQSDDIGASIKEIRTSKIRGCGVTMPFKREATKFVDKIDDVARSCGAINTIVNDGGVLSGFNTDYFAIMSLLVESNFPKHTRVAVLGSGGAASAVGQALKDSNFSYVTICSRTRNKEIDLPWLPWHSLHNIDVEFLINASSVGFQEDSDFRFPVEQRSLESCETVWDLVSNPKQTDLLIRASKAGKKTVSGVEISKRQAVRQFELYTGKKPTADQIERAFKWASS